MIQIYAPATKDFTKNGIELFPLTCSIEMGINQSWVLELENALDDRYKNIVEEAIISAPTTYGERQLFRIKSVEKTDDSIFATAFPIFMDSANEVLIVDKRPTDKNGQEALDILMSGTKYRGHSDIDTVNTAYYQLKNLIECIASDDENSFLSRWGGEIRFDNFDIHINKRLGSDNGVRVEFGFNLSSVKESIDMSNVVTRIVPVAYNGRLLPNNETVDSPLLSKYAIVYEKKIEYSDLKLKADLNEGEETEGAYETEEELYAAMRTRALLEYEDGIDLPSITYEVDMIDLARTKEYSSYKELVTVNLGDTVRVRHRRLDIETEARIIALEFDCISRRIEKLTIGDYQTDFIDDVDSTSNSISNIVQNMEGVKTELFQQLRVVNLKVDGKASIEELEAVKAEIEDLDVGKLTAEVAQIKEAYITKLEAQQIYVSYAKADQIYATKAEVGTLDADVANIKTLLAGSTTTGDLQSIVINSKNATIENGTIKNAMIESLTFDKITGVDINTTTLTVHSNDGKSTWKDNTIQISDGNRTRVQVGKDASNDYNIYIWDKSGKLMFDATGVTADGIQRPIIRDDMVSDTASIAGHKLNIQSVVKEINGGTEKIKSSTVLYDPTGQTMDVAFNEMVSNSLSGGFEYEGNSYSGKASDYGIEIREAEGAYSQKTTKGYQLFNYTNLGGETAGGATVTKGKDGTYTITGSGALTGTFAAFYTYAKEWFQSRIKAGNITLKTGRTGGRATPAIYFNIIDETTSKAVVTCYENQTVEIKQEWLEDDKYFCRIGFWSAKGDTITPATLKPMLYQQGDGAWEEFTGGLPIPNPDYPSTPKFFQPTKFYSLAKNMTDFNLLKDAGCNAGTKKVSNNSFTLTSTGTDCYELSYSTNRSNFTIPALPNTKYTLLYKRSTVLLNRDFIFEYDENKALLTPYQNKDNSTDLLVAFTITTKPETRYINFRVGMYNEVGKSCTYSDFMILKGEVTWEDLKNQFIPYGGFKETSISDLELAALPNGMKDVFYDGAITKKVGYYQVSEVTSIREDENTKRKYVVITIPEKAYIASSTGFLCDRFTHAKIDSSADYGIYENQANVVIFGTPKDTLETMREKIVGTKIWYRLDKPTTTKFNMPVIPSYYPYTTAYHNSEVPTNIKWFIRTQITSEEYSNLSTQVSIANGEISTLISKTTQMQTDLTDAKGSITELTTKYNQVKQTVDSYGVTIGEHTSKIETANKNIKEVSDKQSSMQLDLDGFKTSVSQTYSTKSETTTAKNEAISTASKDAQTKADKAKTDAISSANANTANLLKSYSTTTQMNSAIQQSANSITQKVTAVETKVTTVTNTVNNNKSTWDKAGTALTTANEAKEAANLADKTYKSSVDLSASTYDEDTFYPVVGSSIPRGDGYHRLQCIVELNSGTKPSWATHSNGDFTVNVDARIKRPGWGSTDLSTLGWIDDFSYRYADQMPAYITVMGNSSLPVFYLRGGGRYFLFTDYSCAWSIKTSKYEISSQSVSPIKLPSKPKNSSDLVNNWEQRTELKETVSKVATIEVNLDSITSRVSKTESSITSVDGKVTSLTSRVTTAESKITDTAIVNTVRSSTSYKNDLNGKVSSSQIISTINQTAEAIKISASKIQLEGIVTANSRFKILTDGSMEAVNGKFSGTINATSGTIGKWDLSTYAISSQYIQVNVNRYDVGVAVGVNDDMSFNANGLCFWAGSPWKEGAISTPSKAPFRVYRNGKLYATNASITGTISGSTISGSTITGGSITSGTNINVSTDLHVGNNIYIGDPNNTSTKKILFNNTFMVQFSEGRVTMGVNGTGLKKQMYVTQNGITLNHDLITLTGSVSVFGDFGVSSSGYVELVSTSGGIKLQSGSKTLYFEHSGIGIGSNTFRPAGDINGQVTLGNPGYLFYRLYAKQTSISSSDERLKTNIKKYDSRFEKMYMDLEPVTYEWKDERGQAHGGMIAQWLKKAMDKHDILETEFGAYEHDKSTDSYAIAYTEFISLNTHMIQKNITHLSKHDEEICKLKDEIAQLQSKLNAYIDGTIEIKRA